MRPRPSEVIRGVRRILDEVIGPELDSEHARARLREVRAVLTQVDWDDAALEYLAETDRIGEQIADLVAWIRSGTSRARHFSDVLSRLPAATLSQEPAVGARFVDIERRRNLIDAWVVEVLDPLDRWIAEHPDDATAEALRWRLASRYLDVRD